MSTFEDLTPDVAITAVEDAMAKPFTGFTSSLPSYINRVYELEATDKTRYIAKFYRPGRWALPALQQEHRFVLDCAEEEIPVIAPLELADGSTLGLSDGIYFAVYPKRWGREIEVNTEEDWIRLGHVLGRIHLAGSQADAPDRVKLHPNHSLTNDIEELKAHGHITGRHLRDFASITDELMSIVKSLDFDRVDPIRIHGDCHRANILHRPDEGLMVIDFDDMMTGPPVQDLWLLLPGHVHECRPELNLILEGYDQFFYFDYSTIAFIEPLRAMRLIYFLAWCSRQTEDFKFQHNFPNWGTDMFWQREIGDLRRQISVIEQFSHH